ncbi:MAG: hypothetical protein VX777_02935 [Chlamydiota bacterium]|nr:hypothetical protein [Chlamydiota bacterium]
MSTKTKKKLCWNCEGSVGFTEEHCPFCGVYLSPSPSAQEPINQQNSYSPPYVMETEEPESDVPQSPYQDSHQQFSQEAVVREKSQLPSILPSDQMRQILFPLGLLLAGSGFFLFGLVLFLFSNNGSFTLQWNADNWYYYLVLSVAMLFFGWRALNEIDDDDFEQSE